MEKRSRVCILTSSHNTANPRVFHKQAVSLAEAGYDVTYVVPHEADTVIDGVRIKAIPKRKNRLKRILLTPARVFWAGLAEKADVYHFHDPELIPYGLILRALGNKVIYDAHEYNKLKIMSKSWIPSGLRYLAALAFDSFESLAARVFNGVIVVDGVTEGKFNGKATVVGNYPYKNCIVPRPAKTDGAFRCVYVGGLNGERGLFKMVEAMEHVDSRIRLVLAGHVKGEDLDKAQQLKRFEKVKYLGVLPWPEALKLLTECDLGLVLLQPVPAYIYAGENTVKLFEYMATALPVLVSNFPNLERIIIREGCGDTVDPTDPMAIAKKITYFADNPEIARRMGENGRKAVMDKYTWETEKEKLLGLYCRILGGGLTICSRKAEA